MKLKKYNDLIREREGFDHIDDVEDDDDLPNIEDVEEYDQNDVVDALLSTIRKMTRNAGFNRSFVFTDDEGCINIQFILNKTEKMNNIMSIMDLLKKFEEDILMQYESEFDLWESKEGDPILTGKFFFEEEGHEKAEKTVFFSDDDPPF